MSQATLDAPPLTEARRLIEQIRTLVARNRVRWKWLTVLEGLGLTVSALLAYLWVIFWLDNVLHLSTAGRVAASAVLLAGFIYLAVGLVRRWRRLRFTEDQVALAIERRTPGGVQNRLINAIQIARASSAEQAELSLAVIEENVARIQALELEQAAALRPAVVRMAVAGALIAAGFAFYFFQPERFTNAATRILLPFGDVEPLYRTTLTVTPGDIEAVGDVTLSIDIHGERPNELALLEDIKGKRQSLAIPVPPGSGPVQYVLKDVQRTMLYAVRGGDYTTRFYQITVPMPSHLNLLKCLYRYPEYSGLAEKRAESASGDLEALRGTTVDLELTLDQPCEETVLVVENASIDADHKPTRERVPLKLLGPTKFAGTLKLDRQLAYQLETRQAGRQPHTSKTYTVRVIDDLPPKLELTGLEGKSAVDVDASLPLQLAATDDLGLDQVGIFFRRTPDAAVAPVAANNDWKAVETWPADGKLKLDESFDLALLAVGAAEGESIDIALRATDRDPAKADRWTEGNVYHLKVGGEAARLQLVYEQILKTESELKQIITAQRRILVEAADWIKKLDGEGNLKWDDAKNVQALHAAAAEQAKGQEELRGRSGQTARAMVEEAGSLRLSVGMLADTEMVRAVRIFESVPTRDQLQAKRAALSEVQLTAQRTMGSLQQIVEQYVQFRQDWELAHMTPLIKMLAERQAALRETSLVNAERPRDKLSDLWQASAGRRQEKVLALVKLCETACTGLGEKLEDIKSPLAPSFFTAANGLADDALTSALEKAVAQIKQAHWKTAAAEQATAAEELSAIHAALRKAQIDAAKQAIAALEEKAKTDLDAQKELERLKAGTDKASVELPEKLSIKDIIHMQELASNKSTGGDDEEKVNDYLFADSRVGSLQTKDTGKRQEFDILKLGNSAGKTPSYPAQSDREANKVTPYVQEDFEDLVGKLLEEADEMKANYETFNLNTSFNINEPGEVGKQGGDMNSTAAAAATGNKKPPTVNVGGISRSGRRGARSHGLVVGDESVNRRGRDKVQEGQERVADQAGTIKETKSDDPQTDTSTGVGGKKVESDDTKFSVADAGKWTDDMAQRMGKPQDKNYIVERQDGRIDPRVAEMLRDMTSDHEQIIERVKAIRKELKNLYLPTDHLDELLAEMSGQLERMKERPTAELFRREQQTLDKLRAALKVFHQAHAGFQPSVPREQVVRGHVLDDADRPAPPGYEQAVKRYYEKLSLGAQR